MPLASTTPLRRELTRALPDRPFAVRFWDGTEVPATHSPAQPVFTINSPGALAHALRAPGQLGIGRAYVDGSLDVDDMDATIRLLDQWKPPSLDRKAQAR